MSFRKLFHSENFKTNFKIYHFSKDKDLNEYNMTETNSPYNVKRPRILKMDRNLACFMFSILLIRCFFFIEDNI